MAGESQAKNCSVMAGLPATIEMIALVGMILYFVDFGLSTPVVTFGRIAFNCQCFGPGDLATYRAVTGEQDPPPLRGAPPAHTSSFALSVRWILNRLALPGANG